MKRAVISQLEQLKSKLTGYITLLTYRYGNLCIEANPYALMPVQVFAEGEVHNIEDLAQVAVREKYHFAVAPIYDEDLFAIGQAVMTEHPEFKQEVKTLDGYAEDDPAGKYLYFTMPEVDKSRHDELQKEVDELYDACRERMDAAEDVCVAKLAELQADASQSEQEQTADKVKEIVDKYKEMCENTHNDKKKEVEDAYAEYQQRQAEKDAEQKERQEAEGNPKQMKLNADD